MNDMLAALHSPDVITSIAARDLKHHLKLVSWSLRYGIEVSRMPLVQPRIFNRSRRSHRLFPLPKP